MIFFLLTVTARPSVQGAALDLTFFLFYYYFMKNYTIHVDREEVLTWITGKKRSGQPGSEAEKEFLPQIERMAATVESAALPRYLYAVFSLRREPEAEKIYLPGTSLTLAGRDICSLLHSCSGCILLAVTLGAPLDRALKRAQISDMADAFLLDLCASSAAENLCDTVNEELEAEYEQKGYFLTDRFSPGYGDFPVSLQNGICRILQTEKRIGLTVNSSDMLIPSKSITAVIGIADHPQPKKISGCRYCRMKETCNFRKAGKTCE